MTPLVELVDVSKDYRGLRPLRIAHLAVAAGEQVALHGLDQMAAEMFVNLLTGATLPDSGDIQVFGRSTAAIRDSTEWLALVDRFGIVSERAVLLDQLSVLQNLCVPFTLDIEPPPQDVRRRAESLAQEVGLGRDVWTGAVAGLDGAGRARVRLARALALDPAVLIVEHLTAHVARPDVPALGADIGAVARRRGTAIVAASADADFSRAMGARILALDAVSGKLSIPGVRGWFRSRLG